MLTILLNGCDGGPTLSLGDTSHGAIAACEAATMKTLVSPVSYRLAWSNYTAGDPLDEGEEREYAARHGCPARRAQDGECEPGNVEAFVDAYSRKLQTDVQEKVRAGRKLTRDEQLTYDIMRQGEQKRAANPAAARSGFVTLEYDSVNSFGAVLRGFGICRFGPIGDDGKFVEDDVFQVGPIPRSEGERAKAVAIQLKKMKK